MLCNYVIFAADTVIASIANGSLSITINNTGHETSNSIFTGSPAGAYHPGAAETFLVECRNYAGINKQFVSFAKL
jgi:hypothetical protein